MYQLTSKVNSPYDIEGQVLPAFGAITVPALSDYTRLLRDLDVVAIEEVTDTNEDSKKQRKPRKGKENDDSEAQQDRDNDSDV